MTKFGRARGRCRQCGRVVLLTRNGKLFLHSDQAALWEKGDFTLQGTTCAGGMTAEWDAPDAPARVSPAHEGRA